MQAACGVGQLEKLESFIQKRKENVSFLKKKLEDLQELIQLPEAEENSEPSWFGFPITMKDKCKISRKDLIDKLTEKKIGTRLLFAGNLTKQPAYINLKYRVSGELKVTDKIMSDTFWVGIQPALGEEELSYTAKILRENLK
jgi:CDP-6-deoxy-D-xylo-4-hexulose-3-dehydrase